MCLCGDSLSALHIFCSRTVSWSTVLANCKGATRVVNRRSLVDIGCIKFAACRLKPTEAHIHSAVQYGFQSGPSSACRTPHYICTLSTYIVTSLSLSLFPGPIDLVYTPPVGSVLCHHSHASQVCCICSSRVLAMSSCLVSLVAIY